MSLEKQNINGKFIHSVTSKTIKHENLSLITVYIRLRTKKRKAFGTLVDVTEAESNILIMN